MLTFLEAGLQVHLFHSPLQLPEDIYLLSLSNSIFVSVHDTHFVNTVGPILPEVVDHKVSLLLCGIRLLCLWVGF